MPAAVGSAASRPQINDLVIEGSLLSVQHGSAVERVSIGFSAGESELKVAVEGYQMTATGLHKLGSSDVTSTGNKTPGMAVGIASWAITHNPAGFILTTGMKSYGEAERQQHDRGPSPAYIRGDRRTAQDALPGAGLDQRRPIMNRGVDSRTAQGH